MKFRHLLEIVGDAPLFETGLLLAGAVDPANVRRQLSRWCKSGRVYQLRRGVYALAPPFQKVVPHPFLVANWLVHSSYVSLHSALAHHGLIPEAVLVTTSVSTSRPAGWDTPLGRFEYRHVKTDLLFGFELTDLGSEQAAFVATPEKALLDLVYLQPGGDAPEYLGQLRLQNLERLDLDRLRDQAAWTQSPKLRRAADRIIVLAEIEAQEYEFV
jgi:predicted transcriptional regulator of viral defense system